MLYKTILLLVILASTSCGHRQIRNLAVNHMYKAGIELAHSFEPNISRNQNTSICFELKNDVSAIQPIINSSTNKVFEQYNLIEVINKINPDSCDNVLIISNIETKNSRHPMSIRLEYYISKVRINVLAKCYEDNVAFSSASRQKIKIHEFHSSEEGFALSSASIYLALKATLLDIEQQYKNLCS